MYNTRDTINTLRHIASPSTGSEKKYNFTQAAVPSGGLRQWFISAAGLWMIRTLEPCRFNLGNLKTKKKSKSGTSIRNENAISVTSPRHNCLTEDVGEAATARTCSLCIGESPVRHPENEGHTAVTETM
jgi:hypothetical protein